MLSAGNITALTFMYTVRCSQGHNFCLSVTLQFIAQECMTIGSSHLICNVQPAMIISADWAIRGWWLL